MLTGSVKFLTQIGRPVFIGVALVWVITGMAFGQGAIAPTGANDVSRVLSLKAKVVSPVSATVGQPILVQVTFTNLTGQTQMVGLGNSAVNYVHLSLHDGKGALLGPEPPKPILEGISGGARIEPHGSWLEVFQFPQEYVSQPGDYVLKTQLYAGSPWGPVLEDSTNLAIKPFDANCLDVQCNQLFSYIVPGLTPRGKRISGLNQSVAYSALLSIRNEVALPYFDYLAKQYSDVKACLAIRRVKTRQAKALIKALAARQDDVGKAARKALQMPLEPPKAAQPAVD